MGMNSIEKIIAHHSGKDTVVPGEIVDTSVDLVMTNDCNTALNYDILRNKIGVKKVWDPSRIIMFIDHYVPCNSVESGEYHKRMRQFAREQGVTNTHEGEGICHQIMLERYVVPGQLILGADSHTCTYGALGAISIGMGSTDIAVSWVDGTIWLKVPETIRVDLEGRLPSGVFSKDVILKVIGDLTARGATYKAVEFSGQGVHDMSIGARATMCNMVIEAGGKCAYVQPDEKTLEYIQKRGRESLEVFQPDADARYERVLRYNLADLEPQIAYPHSVENVKPLSEFEGLEIDEAFIGACTNGRLEDLQIAANILKGRRASPNVRLLVTPASREVYRQALDTGLLNIFLDAGAMINNPGCGACYGAVQGILASGERLISTANRNFRGRVGSPESEIYLGSPATVAASAIHGKITDPRKVVQND